MAYKEVIKTSSCQGSMANLQKYVYPIVYIWTNNYDVLLAAYWQ